MICGAVNNSTLTLIIPETTEENDERERERERRNVQSISIMTSVMTLNGHK